MCAYRLSSCFARGTASSATAVTSAFRTLSVAPFAFSSACISSSD